MADEMIPDEDALAYTPRRAREAWLVRRRRRIREEIERSRRGEYTIPTWALAVMLVVFVAAWAALVILS
jgi:hypothetical protein